MVALNLRQFELGSTVATPGALAALKQAGQTPDEFLHRHARGDWGAVSESGKQANDLALKHGSRIFSVYLLSAGAKLWVITEALNDKRQRASTCLLLPDEY